MAGITNANIFNELTHIKSILIGDGTPESMEDSIQYRLTQVESKVDCNGVRKSDGNGGYLERRTKKSWRQQFKETPLIKKLAFTILAIPFLGSYWKWIFTSAHEILNWIEALPK